MKKVITFKEMNPLEEYDTDEHDTLNDFWLPALSCSGTAEVLVIFLFLI